MQQKQGQFLHDIFLAVLGCRLAMLSFVNIYPRIWDILDSNILFENRDVIMCCIGVNCRNIYYSSTTQISKCANASDSIINICAHLYHCMDESIIGTLLMTNYYKKM